MDAAVTSLGLMSNIGVSTGNYSGSGESLDDMVDARHTHLSQQHRFGFFFNCRFWGVNIEFSQRRSFLLPAMFLPKVEGRKEGRNLEAYSAAHSL